MGTFGRRMRKHFTYANVAATLALVFAMGGTAAAAVMINSNSQIGRNTIAGHSAPAGKHANVIAGSINGSDIANPVKASWHDRCPYHLKLGGDLCYDANPRSAEDFQSAFAYCGANGFRLPTPGELLEVFNVSSAVQPAQFTSNYATDNGFLVEALSQDQNRDLTFSQENVGAGARISFRCVATPTS